MSTSKAMAAAFAAVALWSLNALAAGQVLTALTAWQMLTLEFGAAAVALVVARVVVKRHAPSRHPTLGGAALGAVGIGGTICFQNVAFAAAPLLAANAIAYAWPLLATIWAALGQQGSRARAPLALAALGFGGVLMLFAGRGAELSTGALTGYLAALASAAAMAFYTVTARHTQDSTLDLLLAGTAIGALVSLPIALAQSQAWGPGWALALSAAIGIAMLGAGYGCWTLAMASPAGHQLAPIGYATPLLSTALLLIGGYRLPLLGLAGCGLLLICAIGAPLCARAQSASPAPCPRASVPASRHAALVAEQHSPVNGRR